jgi:hypothetical protein
MIRKSTLLAVAASAALGLAMLAPTSASAMRGGGGGGMHGGGGGMHGGGGGMHGGGGMRIPGGHGGPNIGIRWPHPHPHWHVHWHRPIWYGGIRTVGYTVANPVAGPCTCLSKEYTEDGRVLFKDLCTNEAAINPPVIAPQQSSSLEAPVEQTSAAQPNVKYQTAPANALPQVDPLTGQPK